MVTVRDETTSGREISSLDFDLPATVTLRDLIRFRVREEVARYNANGGEHFSGLVQPTDAEVTLNGYRMRAARLLNWEQQAQIALDGFGSNAYFVLVGARQMTELDEVFVPEEEIAFIRLVPLVGG